MQGFNMGRYVPPDAEGVLTANQASGKGHALGRRAAKLKTEGALTVRFEMPFAVWCDGCEAATARPQVIGQGVRFNAEKRRAGSYLSTPVWSFRMRHAACGGWLEIRTDPQRTTYDVVSGGRRRDTAGGDDKASAESLVASGAAALLDIATTPAERDEQRASAFSSLERTIEDRAALAAAGERIEAIEDLSTRQWDDPYARNQVLRRAFRVGRKQRERDGAVTEALRDRMGLGIELLPESEEDARRARLVDFGRTPEGAGDGRRDAVLARPLFVGDDRVEVLASADENKSGGKKSGKVGKKLKSEVAASKTRKSLVSEIVGNTRLASDPFLEPRNKDSKPASLIPGLKRKRDPARESSLPPEKKPAEKMTVVPSALVDYDSD